MYALYSLERTFAILSVAARQKTSELPFSIFKPYLLAKMSGNIADGALKLLKRREIDFPTTSSLIVRFEQFDL